MSRDFPFMLRLSKHPESVSSNLLGLEGTEDRQQSAGRQWQAFA